MDTITIITAVAPSVVSIVAMFVTAYFSNLNAKQIEKQLEIMRDQEKTAKASLLAGLVESMKVASLEKNRLDNEGEQAKDEIGLIESELSQLDNALQSGVLQPEKFAEIINKQKELLPRLKKLKLHIIKNNNDTEVVRQNCDSLRSIMEILNKK